MSSFLNISFDDWSRNIKITNRIYIAYFDTFLKSCVAVAVATQWLYA